MTPAILSCSSNDNPYQNQHCNNAFIGITNQIQIMRSRRESRHTVFRPHRTTSDSREWAAQLHVPEGFAAFGIQREEIAFLRATENEITRSGHDAIHAGLSSLNSHLSFPVVLSNACRMALSVVAIQRRPPPAV